MIDFEKEETLPVEARFRIWARRLQFWRLCANGACIRARACRGAPRRCVYRFADWVEAVQDEARRERAKIDPAAQALRAELKVMIERLSRSMAGEA
ncbi:MAG: hypothetical protein R6X03_10780 [Methyloceanibacter sp.]